jgi:signal peptidase
MKKLLKIILAFTVLVFGFSLYIFSNQIGGWRAFTVMSGSMEPGITTGSIVITRYTHPSRLGKSEIITFIAPTKERPYVTHRITNVEKKQNIIIFRTKGDNNDNEDEWALAGGGVVGRMVFSIPYLGYFISFAQSKPGLVLLILLPAAYIIINEAFDIWRLLKKGRRVDEKSGKELPAIFIIIFSMMIYTPLTTRAILKVNAGLIGNSLIAGSVLTPSPTLMDRACTDFINVEISNNGPGSVNTSDISVKCSFSIIQSNKSSVFSSVDNKTYSDKDDSNIKFKLNNGLIDNMDTSSR